MSKPNLIQIVKSVLAAMIGVQSDKNRKIDFEQGNLSSYIIVGVGMTLLFVVLLVTIVNYLVD